MRAFQEPIASPNKLVPGARPKQRRIVANTKVNLAGGANAPPQRPGNSLNQLAFAHSHT
jgi:hypothetical protein